MNEYGMPHNSLEPTSVINQTTFARRALSEIPKLLTLQDRNPHSPTFGCFDRNYWHFKIIDFPSGMSQEFVWPLALAINADVPVNPYHKSDTMRDWVEAGIRYAALSSHRDGSCDDYYPFERATGAAAFSLLACIEGYLEIGLEDQSLLGFFRRRADWLAGHRESGRLSNHEALVIMCLLRLIEVIGADYWSSEIENRLERLLSWQSNEGWFAEYEGFDAGYHTLTISLLARIYKARPTSEIRDALVRAVKLAAEFIHPDGSYGGEYFSRNTLNFFPHGFELVGEWMPEALAINDLFLCGLTRGLSPCYSDDHIIGHHLWNYLLASRDYIEERPKAPTRKPGRHQFSEAGIFIDRRGGYELYVALNKGGVFKLFKNDELVVSDTQVSLLSKHGNKVRNAVSHLMGTYQTEIDDNNIIVSGDLGWAKQTKMTTIKLIVLRIVMLSFGRFFPNLIRSILQRLLITGKEKAPYNFLRKFHWQGNSWCVEDKVWVDDWENIVDAGVGGSQTSIYVVMSRLFQISQLQPWHDLGEKGKAQKSEKTLHLKRVF